MSGEGLAERRTLTARRVAELVGGELEGDGDVAISAVAPLHRADLSMLAFLSSAKYAEEVTAEGPGILLVSPELAGVAPRSRARILVKNPQEAMLRLLPWLYVSPRVEPGVHPSAVVGANVELGSDVSIGPFAVIGDGAHLGDRVYVAAHAVVGRGVQVGSDSQLYEHVVLYAGSSLGDRVIVHSGARIGSDGFGYVFSNGAHEKIPHVGRCIIEQDVEIGANSTIDRGSIDDTVIGAGTKIDNLVHVAHNVRVGRLCLIMAQVGIAGSVRIGDGAILAGQAGVAGHVTIGAGARLAAQAGVFGNIPPGETWSGYPARPHREALRAHAALFKLSGMMQSIQRLVGKEDAPS